MQLLGFLGSEDELKDVEAAGDNIHLWECDEAEAKTTQWDYDPASSRLQAAERCLVRRGYCQHCSSFVENELVLKQCSALPPESSKARFEWSLQPTSGAAEHASVGCGLACWAVLLAVWALPWDS